MSSCLFATGRDAVKGVRQQVIDFLAPVDGRPAAVDLVQGGVGVAHPLHQPLEFAIAQQVVASQVPSYNRIMYSMSAVRDQTREAQTASSLSKP